VLPYQGAVDIHLAMAARLTTQGEAVTMNRKGFTLIELLIVVVIIGILAAIAIPKFANTKQKAIVASMKTDLKNLVTAQEAFFSDNNDYAGAAGPNQVNGIGGAGTVNFQPTTGNILALTYISAAGFNATMTNPAVAPPAVPSQCGVYVGTGNAPGGMPAPNQEGAPMCW
jgi:prepilin-type N-terminal cleavage/methylation domain-containing protein